MPGTLTIIRILKVDLGTWTLGSLDLKLSIVLFYSFTKLNTEPRSPRTKIIIPTKCHFICSVDFLWGNFPMNIGIKLRIGRLECENCDLMSEKGEVFIRYQRDFHFLACLDKWLVDMLSSVCQSISFDFNLLESKHRISHFPNLGHLTYNRIGDLCQSSFLCPLPTQL